MAKQIVGFDIGAESVRLAVCEGDQVCRIFCEPLPDNFVRDGTLLSYDAMGELLSKLRSRYHISARDAALVLPSRLCFCRRLTMPAMTAQQLAVNLPYEFRDYTVQEKDRYFYDYALVDTVLDEDGQPKQLDLMAAAAAKQTVRDYAEMFRHAGFRLKLAIPVELAYINLLRLSSDGEHGHCILDLGRDNVRIYMFDGCRFDVLRVLDYGCAALDRVIADTMNVDAHIAHASLLANTDGVQELPACREIYNMMGVDLLKAINFYSFNYPDKELTHIHCCGGGVKLAALLDTLERTVPVPLKGVYELLPHLPATESAKADFAAAAIGAAIQEGGARA